MKSAAVFLLSTLFFSHVLALEYKGDLDSFTQFVGQYELNWQPPETIDYFEPAKGKGLIRYAHWVPKGNSNKGVVVHFNGRTEFIEKNIYSYADLLGKGYEVWSLDWRGQGLSARDLKEKQKHNISSFNEYLRDANFFLDKVVELNKYQGKKILLAHSMGGQIALRYLLQEDKSKFDVAVLSSPLLKVPSDSKWVRAGNDVKRIFLGKSCAIGKQADWTNIFKEGESCTSIGSEEKESAKPRENIDINIEQYSNDIKKLAEINCLIESSIDANGDDKPDLRLACPTSNWLNAAFESTDITMEQASQLNTPTLILRVDPDYSVDVSSQDEFCTLSDQCTLETVPAMKDVQPGHELLIEKEFIREYFFERFDKYVGSH